MFIWRLIHRRTPTFAYLHRLNIVLNRECCFCGLDVEIDEYVLWRWSKSHLTRNVISSIIGVDLNVINHLSDGEWLTQRWNSKGGS